MKRLVHQLKGQSIGVVALFVALGGTGYAALHLPANSVGPRQIRAHAVGVSKLDPATVGGVVRFYAVIDQKGRVIESRPRVKVLRWDSGIGSFSFAKRIPPNCFAQATGVHADGTTDQGYATTDPLDRDPNVFIEMINTSGVVGASTISVAYTVTCPA